MCLLDDAGTRQAPGSREPVYVAATFWLKAHAAFSDQRCRYISSLTRIASLLTSINPLSAVSQMKRLEPHRRYYKCCLNTPPSPWSVHPLTVPAELPTLLGSHQSLYSPLTRLRNR